jgi:hypothetical protein
VGCCVTIDDGCAFYASLHLKKKIMVNFLVAGTGN